MVVAALIGGHANAFDFEVECESDVASEPQVAEYFKQYIGKWSGVWEKHQLLRYYQGDVRQIAESFQYGQKFRVEVMQIKGCDIGFKVFYAQKSDDYTLYNEKLMTKEGLYMYWNSPTIDGTYILIYDPRKDVLDGVLQLFTGQDIASIALQRQ